MSANTPHLQKGGKGRAHFLAANNNDIMSKLTSLITLYPKRFLLAIVALSLGVFLAFGTGAVFTSATANPSNTFTAGNLSMSNSKNGSAILTASLMRPGDSTNGTVVITNTGDISGAFSLAESNVVSTPGPNGGNLAAQLDLKVEDITGTPTTVYTGKLNALASTPLGTFAASEARTYKFTVTFPDGGTPPGATTGDNAFKSSAASVQFDWTATS